MITARPITTRYDTPENSPISVATPSCCCCCCCIATIAAVMTFGAKHISNEKTSNGGSGFAPWLAGLALPITVGFLVAVGPALDSRTPIIALGAVAFVAIYAIAYRLAGGSSALRAIASPVIVLILGALFTVGELFVVIYSAGIAWLLIIPFGIWAAYQVADSLIPSASPASVPADDPPSQDPFS